MHLLPYFIVYVLPVVHAVGVFVGGWATWLVPGVVFVAIPLGDQLFGHDRVDPDASTRRAGVDVPLRLWLVVQVAALALSWWRIEQGVTWVEAAGLTASMGLITGGAGINVAHELMHRRSSLDRALAEVLMTLASYPWFCVEHMLGHHRTVATPADPATARFGQSLWAFLPQSIVGGLVSAWRLEGERCARRGIGPWSIRNRRLRHAGWLVLVYGGAFAIGGGPAVAFFAMQALVAVVALETINYVEHYGLERQLHPRGGYERVQPHHSWNSTLRFTNWFTFNLQRHADHHAVASRPYDQLRACADAPQLPLGYPSMMMLAAVPPVWFRVMNARVRAVQRS